MFYGHGYRSRVAQRGGNASSHRSSRDSQAPLLSRPYGPEIDSIDTKTLFIDEKAPKIKNAEYVASYNWLEGKHPIILVPGCPPAWTPPTVDSQLKPDSGAVFRDINAARHSTHPMEPAVRSILSLKPKFNLKNIDIVGCGSTFGNLLRFVSLQSKPFRFDVDILADTVFFVRRENSPTEVIDDLRGYGHTFPERYTTWNKETRGSCSHQRIVQYEFGGIHILVRSETDAYLKSPDDQKVAGQGKSSVSEDRGSIADLTEALSAGVLKNNSLPTKDQPLCLKKQGKEVAQSQIFDIKTRMDGKTYDMSDILPRLWINRTSKFLIAYHQRGLFNNPVVQDVRTDVLRWEAKNAAMLGIFHAILKRVIDAVRDSDTQQVEISWDGEGPLRITEQVGKARRALPVDLHSVWESYN